MHWSRGESHDVVCWPTGAHGCFLHAKRRFFLTVNWELGTDVNIDRFKHDHVVQMQMVTDLRGMVQAGVADNASAIAKQLIAMSSVIRMHLAAEDRVLYPVVAQARDPAIAEMGRRFQKEMGGLAASYMAFVGRWNGAKHIGADPEAFRVEANAVFKALHDRVHRENTDLYPVVERL